ncbi:lysophospholipid acyltransferase family protein [Aridibaculum aurantiacum]|uniref:lysophospholipid acyltransferase family protein n=1 Tax=Aridibaculum aurantiacum TaxID=2810307 RepID=UPI001A9619F1|nr:lysophospholipid acyltransferase family protein [Aridibaculum aurantiacum]
MSTIKNIFGRIWALWGIIVFTATLLIVIIPILLTFLIAEPKGTAIFRIISKAWMNVFLTLIGCRIIIKGKDNFKKGETYVVVSNHNSLMDVPLTTPYIPGANRTIAKKSMAKVPLFGWVYTRGSVLVDRNSDESRRKSFDLMKQTLAQGLHMVIYPEGTRNRTKDPLKQFYDGAFKLATDTGKEIIPTLIFNTRKVLPPNKTFYLEPHTMEMHFLSPIPTKGRTSKEVKEQVFRIMWEYFKLHESR